MQFLKVLPPLFSEMETQEIDFALIGGLALYAYGINRTTFDADFLILHANAAQVDRMMKIRGYKPINKTDTFVNYVSDIPGNGQVDFMLAQKKESTEMLQKAEEHVIFGHKVKIVRVEDIIGLKVLSSTNDPRRAPKDLWDMEDLMTKFHLTMDWERVKSFFVLFDREEEFKILKKRTK